MYLLKSILKGSLHVYIEGARVPECILSMRHSFLTPFIFGVFKIYRSHEDPLNPTSNPSAHHSRRRGPASSPTKQPSKATTLPQNRQAPRRTSQPKFPLPFPISHLSRTSTHPDRRSPITNIPPPLLQSFQGVVPLLPAPIPPSTPPPTPIPLDSLTFHNFYPFGQLSYPDYTRPNFTTLNTALVHLLLKPSEHARIVVANKTLNPEGGVVKAFALEGFDWKASRNGTGPPMVGEMSVRCWTVDRGRGGEVVEKGGLEFLDARLVKVSLSLAAGTRVRSLC